MIRWVLLIGAVALVGSVVTLVVLELRRMPASPHDREIAYSPGPAGEVAISIVGTSLTAYYDWPDLLADRLETSLDRPVRVSRVAKGGETSGWGLQNIGDIVSQAPDIVLIEFAINDADLRRRISLGTSIENHRRLIAGLRRADPSVAIVLVTMSPAYGLRRALRPRLAGYYDAYRQIAQDTDTGLIDLYPRWLADDARRQAIPDGVHPTEAASSNLIVPTVASYLEDMLVKS